MSETTTIEVQNRTWEQLHRRKDRGDSFDDVLQRLLERSPTIHEFKDGDEPECVGAEAAEPNQRCEHMHPDKRPSQCEDEADYVVTMEFRDKEQEIRLCDTHANIPEEDQ